MDERSPSTPQPRVPPRRLDPSAAGGAGSTRCPTCGRSVEAGFKFCDGCGTRLDAVRRPARPADPVPPLLEPIAPVEADRGGRLESAVGKVRDLLSGLRGRQQPRPEPRRAPRLEDAFGSERTQDRPASSGPPPAPAPPVEPLPGAVSRARTAEELRGAKPSIAGRVRWVRGGDAAPAGPADVVEADPGDAVPETAGDEGSAWPQTSTLAFQIAISFLAGGILLLLITALASVASDGRVAILETRGLPIFIGGAASVVVFALMRTASSRPVPTPASRRSALGTVIAGLAVLVLAAAVLYQPAIASRVQPRVERVLKVFGSEDEQAVKAFEQALVAWNEQAGEYHQRLQATLGADGEFDRFREDAAATEAALQDLVEQMRSAAQGAKHPALRDALEDLSSVYDDQLGGLRLVNRGLLVDSIELVRRGDTRFKDAQERARALFDSRLRELLERGGFDPASFGNAIPS